MLTWCFCFFMLLQCFYHVLHKHKLHLIHFGWQYPVSVLLCTTKIGHYLHATCRVFLMMYEHCLYICNYLPWLRVIFFMCCFPVQLLCFFYNCDVNMGDSKKLSDGWGFVRSCTYVHIHLLKESSFGATLTPWGVLNMCDPLKKSTAEAVMSAFVLLFHSPR